MFSCLRDERRGHKALWLGRRLLFVAACVVALAAPDCARAPAERILVRNEFTASAEGWRISGDTKMTEPVFSLTGGHPGGCITGIDEALGETWFFRAPPEIVKLLPSAVNGAISYSLKQSGPWMSLIDDDVVILGRAGRLSYRFPNPPGMDWTEFAVRLSEEAGWTWNWNKRATQAQIASVLGSPFALQIRGEFVTGDDQGSLDNFVLTAAP